MKMSHSNGITYKLNISREIDTLLEKGALVYMFEFGNEFEPDLLNLCNGLIGKKTGAYGGFRNDVDMHFDAGKQIFKALPMSAVRKNFPLGLFDKFNGVGLLIDPRMVDFIAISDCYIFNEAPSSNTITFTNTNRFNDSHIFDVNRGLDAVCLRPAKSRFEVSIYRSEGDKKDLEELFKNYLWENYAKGTTPESADVFEVVSNNLKNSSKKKHMFSTNITSEILANVPKDAVKGIVLTTQHTNPISYMHSGDAISDEMEAVLVREFVKLHKEVSLPIIRYEQPQISSNNEIMQAPGFKEIDVDMKKVMNVLNNDKHTREYFERFLGKERVQDMILGKTKITIGGV